MKLQDEDKDREICRLWGAGNWQGMELMFRKYYKRLVVWADTFLEDIQLAEDVVQEFFLGLWEKRKEIQLESPTLTSFLYIAVRNRCLHRLEKRDVLRNTVDLKVVDAVFEEYNEKYDRILVRMQKEIEELPPRTREVMVAVFVNGLKYREVAEKYGISLSTVKTLLGNAVRKLREQVGTDEFIALLFFFRTKNNLTFR